MNGKAVESPFVTVTLHFNELVDVFDNIEQSS